MMIQCILVTQLEKCERIVANSFWTINHDMINNSEQWAPEKWRGNTRHHEAKKKCQSFLMKSAFSVFFYSCFKDKEVWNIHFHVIAGEKRGRKRESFSLGTPLSCLLPLWLSPLQFGHKVHPQKGSYVENLVSNEMSRGGVLGKWLDYNGANLIIGLTNWWIHCLLVFWKGRA
jgi:hypothetical protein